MLRNQHSIIIWPVSFGLTCGEGQPYATPVYRGITPEMIMLDRWGNSVLMDYRLSKLGYVLMSRPSAQLFPF